MIDIKNPVGLGVEWAADQFKSVLAAFLADFITVIPVLLGVSIGMYALLGMISERLAKLGVVGVFIYGGLLVIAL